MVQVWQICVGPNEISQKTVQVAASFLTNADNEEDEFVVVHTYDPVLESSQPPHLKKDHITNTFEPILQRVRSAYEITGPAPLIARVLAVEQKPRSGEIGSRQAFLETAETVVKPDMIFVGSFGAGGTKIDEFGTLSDGITRLARCSVAIIKNTWPVPDVNEGAKFTMAIDGSASSFESAWLLRRLIKPKDTMDCVLICAQETDREREIIERLKVKLSTARSKPEEVPTTYKIVVADSLGKESIARLLCSYSQKTDADFLVTGSQGNNPGSKKGARGLPFGDVTAICANISRTHFICMKPEFVYSTAPAAAGPPRPMKRSGSFIGKMGMLGGQHI